MKINICESLLRRSVENHILTYRHNRREDEILEEKFALYQRQIRFIDHNIHTAECRFEQYAKNNLGLIISYKRKPLEPSKNHQFYYLSTNKNWTTKEYTIQPLKNILQYKNLYEYAFERRSQQYIEELKQKNDLQNLRKKYFMNQTKSLIRDDYERKNDWPLSENARIKLPSINQIKSNHLSQIEFSIDL